MRWWWLAGVVVPWWSSGSGKHLVREPAALGTYLRGEGIMIRRTRHDVGRELPPLVSVPHVVDLDEGALEAPGVHGR